ncbi:hypothetical protein [Kitasatospora purpeofusca]|nr:hypothetical protein [Kitasatospora purpeofusca]MCX4755981.1 hypothetical protein [Kitasatospora purpeofusca]WSR36173.1 hypothetical protein OG715_37630 [Kitasatospora purpeofusca]
MKRAALFDLNGVLVDSRDARPKPAPDGILPLLVGIGRQEDNSKRS